MQGKEENSFEVFKFRIIRFKTETRISIEFFSFKMYPKYAGLHPAELQSPETLERAVCRRRWPRAYVIEGGFGVGAGAAERGRHAGAVADGGHPWTPQTHVRVWLPYLHVPVGHTITHTGKQG